MIERKKLSAQLMQGTKTIGLQLAGASVDKLLDFVTLLHEWNRAYNLTAVRDPSAMITRHLLDSLSLHPYLQGHHIIDVGSGCGCPGIPLAILFPHKHFTLVDSNGKKSRFQHQVVFALGLKNVAVVQERIECLAIVPEGPVKAPVGSIMARAFGSLECLIKSSMALLEDDGCWLAMKSAYPEQEMLTLAHAALPVYLQELVHLEVPGLEAARSLLIFKRGKKENIAENATEQGSINGLCQMNWRV